MTPASLDRAYLDLVGQAVRGQLPTAQAEELRNEENIDRYYAALISLKKSVESQLANHRSRLIEKQHELNEQGDDGTLWKKYLTEAPVRPDGSTGTSPSDWRARVIRFLSAIEDHIQAVKEQRRAMHAKNTRAGDVRVLLESIFDQMETLDEESMTDADERVFEQAREMATRLGVAK